MTNPYLSWAVVLVVAGGLGYYYKEAAPKPKLPTKPAPEKTEPAPAPKKQKRKEKKPAPQAAPSAKAAEKPAPEIKTPQVNQPDEDIDSAEMAKRFTAVQNGASQQLSAGTGSKSQKNKKKKAAAAAQVEAGSSDRSTHTPSTTGADADDDLSSAGSPVVNASAPNAGYVSDMLETPAPGASVLRVTGSMESEPKKQKPQTFKQVETKKQRQQKAKNEARKAEVQEAENQRRKLLEQQLHSARESERREAAKAKPAAPTTNAWQTKPAASNGVPKTAPAPKANVDLLDTFDGPKKSQSPSESKKWDQGLPTEDEQMRMLASNGQDEWTTVPSKKGGKKKTGKADESVSETSASENQPVVTPKPKVTVQPTYVPDILRSQDKGHPLDSDWAA